jgi:uncharacterized protein YjbJ (UPF0337 family)
MKLSTRYQVKGMFRVAKGTVKVIAGKISSNTKLGVTGKIERFAGNIQRKIGKAQGFIGL